MHFTIFIKSTIFFRQWQLQFTLSSSLKPLKLIFSPHKTQQCLFFFPNNVLLLFYKFISQSSHPLSAFYMNSLSFLYSLPGYIVYNPSPSPNTSSSSFCFFPNKLQCIYFHFSYLIQYRSPLSWIPNSPFKHPRQYVKMLSNQDNSSIQNLCRIPFLSAGNL